MHVEFRIDTSHLIYYTEIDYSPDYLSMFFYELNKGIVQFKNVQNLKYHIYSVEGWYFTVEEYKRSGVNSGWLISYLERVVE